MPTYSSYCHKCNTNQEFFAKFSAWKKNEAGESYIDTPACNTCGGVTEKNLYAMPMVTAMGLTSGSFSMWSPIDGSTIHGRQEYFDHMAKHKVVPESDLKGQAEHVQKRKREEQKAETRKAAEDAYRAVSSKI